MFACKIKLKHNVQYITILIISLLVKVSFSQNVDTIYVSDACINIKCEEKICKICFDKTYIRFIDESVNKEFNLEKISKTLVDTISFCSFKSEIMFLKRDDLIILLFTDFIKKNSSVLRLIYYEDRKEIKLQYMKNQQLVYVIGSL